MENDLFYFNPPSPTNTFRTFPKTCPIMSSPLQKLAPPYCPGHADATGRKLIIRKFLVLLHGSFQKLIQPDIPVVIGMNLWGVIYICSYHLWCNKAVKNFFFENNFIHLLNLD